LTPAVEEMKFAEKSAGVATIAIASLTASLETER
jgi:hypothetical protein